MYCGECGAKNKKDDRFCAECGAPLEQEATKEVVKNTTPAKPMSKQTKMIILGVVIAIILLGGVYKVGSNLTNPKEIAKDYIQATINQDGNKLYKYLEMDGDKTFVSKKIFTTLLEENGSKDKEIENYTITGVEYGDGKLTAKVNYSYTLKNSTNEKTSSVKLTKQKDKKYLFFDNWKIADLTSDSTIMKEYKIKVPKNAELTYAGVKVKDKYLSKDLSTDTLDVYVLPQVFTTKTTLKVKLKNGISLEKKVTPSSYYSTYTVEFDKDSLSEKATTQINNKAKEDLQTIYNNAISGKAFSEIKSSFAYGNNDLTELEANYTSLVSDLKEASNTLTTIKFTDTNITKLELDKDGNLEITVKANYDYTIEYKFLSDEVKTHSDTDYSRIKLTFSYDKDNYHLVNAENLEDYFSRY